MLSLAVGAHVREVLCIGAHCDDIEIGCGGALAQLAQANPSLTITLATFTSDATRAAESRAAVAQLLGHDRPVRLELYEFRNSYFPAQWADIKAQMEALRATVQPDLVFTHCAHDRHQDHRVLNELTWNAFRSHLVLEFEIAKYDGDLGAPNVFVPLSKALVDRKIATLLSSYASQGSKPWFTADAFAGLMRMRGIECQSPSGFAEAFYVRKLCLSA
jgi:LmbE family N-acetylglucosaminyl deacetylase